MTPPRETRDEAFDQDISPNDFAGDESALPSETPIDPDETPELRSDEYTDAPGYHDEEG